MSLAPELDQLLAPALVHETDLENAVVTRRVSVGGPVTDTSLAVDARMRDPFAAWWRAVLTAKTPPPVRLDAPALNVVDMFSSVGGLSLGFAEAAAAVGMRTRTQLAVDIDDDALKVYRANYKPRATLTCSARDLVDFRINGRGADASFAYVPRPALPDVEQLVGRVDAIVAGPPCQGHSSLNNRSRGDDPRNTLYLTVPAAALALEARSVIIENVPGVVRDRYGVVNTTIALLEKAGYTVTTEVLAAHRLGWAQTRRRYFLVATRDAAPLDLPEVAARLARDPLPLSWAIGDLNRRRLDDDDVMHSVPELSRENRMRVGYLFEHDEYDMPDAIRPECHQDGTHTYQSVYGRMRWDRPAGTITGGFLTPGRGRFIHPKQPRVMTPREAARVQGFPDWFSFDLPGGVQPSRVQLGTWIGNAVPPILGYTAGLAALGAFAD